VRGRRCISSRVHPTTSGRRAHSGLAAIVAHSEWALDGRGRREATRGWLTLVRAARLVEPSAQLPRFITLTIGEGRGGMRGTMRSNSLPGPRGAACWLRLAEVAAGAVVPPVGSPVAVRKAGASEGVKPRTRSLHRFTCAHRASWKRSALSRSSGVISLPRTHTMSAILWRHQTVGRLGSETGVITPSATSCASLR
jgi:hypothetical protein